ncbi:NSFL1 cofactor p47-like [Argiope bruennichi]|uniref:NSFL1 cofactor p47 like protein n=1 Tax=Argiope bruennichi TaxID=94029 RepID=A0A8T0G189_ARGBR|nr:NSFL1 cofactor p47-like [Argiope bruennichi]KAF8795740.1 NSFL1 cofactor p47 like protein [Argiope bruennichi]
MADSEQSQLIDEFCKVTGTDASRARMYLEANGWDSNLAMSSYFEEADEEPEAENMHSAFPRPGSPKPTFPPTNPSRIATFASLMNNSQNADEEEGQAFYAGGSERSGQQVLGPGKRKAVGNEVVEAMFKAVRQFGGDVVDHSAKRCSSTKLKAFKGAGHVLGTTEGASDTVAGPSDENAPREVEVVLRLWQTGFTVDDGPLRDYNDPRSKEFLECIRKGEMPIELIRGRDTEVHLNIEDHSHEEYVPKKPSVKAFSGTGFRLGNPTPVMRTEAQPGDKNDDGAQENLNLDESKPITSVQIRLADGSRLMMKANHNHTVGDVRRFIVLARPQYSASVFSLMTAFPTKELIDDEATLEAENLLNSVIVQKLK